MIRIFWALIAAVTMGWSYHVINSDSFESINPMLKLWVIKDKKLEIELDSVFLNTNNEVKLEAFDSSGLLSYEVKITDRHDNILAQKEEILLKKNKKVEITMPKLPELEDGEIITYHVKARDWSNSNFFRGNVSSITKQVIVKNKAQDDIRIISKSSGIKYGGSAIVAFGIGNLDKENSNVIDEVFISNGFNKFRAYPFINKYGNLVYISIVAWPIFNNYFDPKIHVVDKAANESTLDISWNTSLPHGHRKLEINMSNDRLRDSVSRIDSYLFENQKGLDLDEEKFKFFNRFIREMDNNRIRNIAMSIKKRDSNIKDFNSFMPISNYRTSGIFGDEYIFRYKSENMGSYRRLGADLISARQEVINKNDGFVAFRGKIGAYGNVAMISYNLGITALYGYLDKIPTVSGEIKHLDSIGFTGNSGLAQANGLSLSILIQGVFANPREWCDEEFIQNINKVINDANNAK